MFYSYPFTILHKIIYFIHKFLFFLPATLIFTVNMFWVRIYVCSSNWTQVGVIFSLNFYTFPILESWIWYTVGALSCFVLSGLLCNSLIAGRECPHSILTLLWVGCSPTFSYGWTGVQVVTVTPSCCWRELLLYLLTALSFWIEDVFRIFM